MINDIKSSFLKIRQKKPLILCLTNYVTMDFMANSLLALGAAPLMSEALPELEELVNISQAVYINIGTLNDAFIERALYAADKAHSLNKPVILDPVGSGASKLRTAASQKIMDCADIIRGNASEIISLSGVNGRSKGVETAHQVESAMDSAITLAHHHNKIIVISGPEDFITDGTQKQVLPFGSELMPLITGMGCTMTAVLSAFAAVNPDHFQASTHAAAYFSLCGQLTHQHTQTPGTFRQAFIDNLYNPDWKFYTDAINNSRVNI
ncbi:hydroxyethylthiazole kinase [Legionella bononiensis]|uniref:Hydroxyethylthiazole kinase n=1 Tax=Legionella bononiensis TaxID=2793102 RepID=A0ABS1W8G5_9GAMM|nr:hydroxyethylthiazole kinase [Legionella bononiensis]MBL7479961.1 hydroxyethylthiazole kinase [Legionella bononiensis]MBL7525525.1 hydroxyethylthiazole kinase [Legionella bononiensis]MBL7561708.1 hydroxyethylthiazole kinase [Legionella bononiensis]